MWNSNSSCSVNLYPHARPSKFVSLLVEHPVVRLSNKSQRHSLHATQRLLRLAENWCEPIWVNKHISLTWNVGLHRGRFRRFPLLSLIDQCFHWGRTMSSWSNLPRIHRLGITETKNGGLVNIETYHLVNWDSSRNSRNSFGMGKLRRVAKIKEKTCRSLVFVTVVLDFQHSPLVN